MSPVFTPPAIPVIPPVSVADRATGPGTRQANRQGYELMKYYYNVNSSFRRYRGVNVWRMTDGTYQMSDPVPGVSFVGQIAWPYPDTLLTAVNGEPGVVNGTISSSWFPGGIGGVGGSGPGGLQQFVSPGIAVEYLGGHSYTVTATEAAALTTAGLGAFLT